MVKAGFGGMMEKDIEDMTIALYMEYEAEMKRKSWRNARSYFPTKYEYTDINSFHHDNSRVLGYPHHPDDSKINAYYDLPPLLPCFKPFQPHTEDRYEPLKEDTDYISDDKSEIGKQRMINITDDDKPFTPKPQPEDGELSFDEDLDDWLKTEMENTFQGMSFVVDDDIQNGEGVISGALSCQLPPKELNPGSFTLPCTYAMADLGASVNVMCKLIFKHLKLANLKETDMVVEMADMIKKAPLGIVENILVKINKFLFPSDFVIIDMLREPSETKILGRPFLATIHAQIDVFKREISLGIREDRVLFDMDRGVYHSKIPVEKVYMCTRSCDNESIGTLDSVDNMQELEVKHEDMVISECGLYVILTYAFVVDTMLFMEKVKMECSNNGCAFGIMRDNGNRMIFTDFLMVRYVNKTIDDTTRERRYYEWVVHNSEFKDNSEATMYENPCKYHHDLYVRNAVLDEWMLDSFDIEADYRRTRDDPYSRRFGEYKKVFGNKIEQLANEYDLRIRKKAYALDDVWEKCKKFHGGTLYPWHNEGFEEEKNSFNRGRSFVCITKQLEDTLPLGRENGSRFMGMIRKEMDEEGGAQRKTFSQQGNGIQGHINSYSCGKNVSIRA
ncbi:phospholipase-like protein [Tanacetum coccineum]